PAALLSSVRAPAGPGGPRRSRHWRHHVAASGAVARIGNNRKVAEFLDDWNRRNIERVSCGRLECPDAALTQDHVAVTAGENVLGREKPLLDRRGDPAFEKHRLAGVAKLS